MERSNLILGGLIVSLFAFLLVTALYSQTVEPIIKFLSATVKQGDTLFVEIHGAELDDNVSAYFLQKNIPFYSDGLHLRAIVGIPVNTGIGTYTFSTFVMVGGVKKTLTQKVRVLSGNFPVQKIWLKKSKKDLYTYEGVQREYDLIGAALKQETPEQGWEGSFGYPANGKVTTKFGSQRVVNGEKGSNHKGVDFGPGFGKPVFAVNGGVVSLVEKFKMHGNTVIINHGQGVSSLYLHLNDFAVKVGDTVKKGDVIGHVGSTGVATGPHLHFAMYVHVVAVNPMSWFKLK